MRTLLEQRFLEDAGVGMSPCANITLQKLSELDVVNIIGLINDWLIINFFIRAQHTKRNQFYNS